MQDTKAALRIQTLGSFHVERRSGQGWLPVQDANWQYRHARQLLGCLLCAPGRAMGRKQVMEALWPVLDIEARASSLELAIRHLQHALESNEAYRASSCLVRQERNMLSLAGQQELWVDADAFEELLAQAQDAHEPGETLDLLEQAAALYQGDFLVEELYAEWAIARRETLWRMRSQLLLELADLRSARGEYAAAIQRLELLLAVEPENEAAASRLMLLLIKLGNRKAAVQVYQRLEARLSAAYQIEPLPDTLALYAAALAGDGTGAGNHPDARLSLQ